MKRTKDYRPGPNIRPLLADLGLSHLDILRRAQLPEDLLSRADPRFSPEEYFRFWTSLEEEADDPMLPVRIVEAMTAEGFAPPILAALCSPNLTIALERLSTYKRLIAPMALDISRSSRTVKATFRWLDTTTIVPQSLVTMEAAFIVRIARMGTREPQLAPLRITSPQPSPDDQAYEPFLGTQIVKGRHLSLTFSRRDAERPFLTANEPLWQIFEPELRQSLSELDAEGPTRDRVFAALLELLPSGQASIGNVASHLKISRRTLQRRLQQEDTSYQSVLNETRERLARGYLRETSLSCAEISFLLGYKEPNSFFRAFHEWTGDSPEHVRRTSRARTRAN